MPFSLLLLSPCFHMNCPFMEVFLQRVTAIFNRFYAHNLSGKWEQVLQTVSPVMLKMFQGHMYTLWCRKCVLLEQNTACRLSDLQVLWPQRRPRNILHVGLTETEEARFCPIYVIFLYGFFFPLYLLFNGHFLELRIPSFHCLLVLNTVLLSALLFG